ncbi:MAG: bifunctional UDP-N-acetylglucosamine diphosphorylase/glucosamine-1-phosphate N-acetyltransferase GlmU [Nitrospiria bacterium]
MKKKKDSLVVIVLAAGIGKRMKSRQAKVLHPVAGRPMIQYVLDLAEALSADRILLVIGHDRDHVRTLLAGRIRRGRIELVVQEPPLGTGHAVLMTRSLLADYHGPVMILNGDHPLLRAETASDLLRAHRESRAAITLLTAQLENPEGYGRILRGPEGEVTGIVEERDAMAQQRQIKEVNSGVYVAQADPLFELLEEIRPDNAQREYYLPDTVHLAAQKKFQLQAITARDPNETLGINTRIDLARAEKVIRRRTADRLMLEGVTLFDPETTVIDSTARVGRDTVIYPWTCVEGETQIGEDCVISSHVRISNSHLGRGVLVKDHCVITDSVLEDQVSVGPFAHLRPGTHVRRNAKIGNFVEVKKSEIGEGSKANHLTYLGDTVIGKGVNIGAGSVTCNYDGVKKSKTIIEDNVFVGSDSLFIAPVKVGRGAIIAAGSIITQDVPAGSLAIGRARQVNKKGWAKKKRDVIRDSLNVKRRRRKTIHE